MKASELIIELQGMIEHYGDLHVALHVGEGCLVSAELVKQTEPSIIEEDFIEETDAVIMIGGGYR